MRNTLTSGLLWFSALGCGLLAGLYFAFSTFVMTALGRIDQAAGISAMNAINVDIVRSLFMPVFLGTTLSCAVLVVLGALRWQDPGAIAMICGGGLYVLGMFVVTAVFNVPLNDQLAAADPASTATAPLWARYLTDWTFWNHVRTVASLAATALFIVAIVAR
ncbi:anthrone oxygenase family protein [Bradyrhizobium sp. NAS96.2]|uniref:anthrone oxygenase family protein n=1 Tax=Bradyrhizobium sp. NAS96.2 TaxID=1680160 RepID=UPI00093ADE9B|nr:anthrone oxygenase family protein [Bradyrhizobium sp. NAS96.2]OKO80633.1 membrane protein [Bradyrhizobium sp. NAS96.2]